MFKIKIKGAGDSVWGESDGKYTVTDIELADLVNDDGETWGEIQMSGPDTKWEHYTDTGIEKAVNSPVVLDMVSKLLKSEGVYAEEIRLDWSEQGMQPKDGWSFDLSIKQL